ncbi:MAG: PQQ-dependent sugar dehydrogenase [Pseudomonadota bacterium]
MQARVSLAFKKAVLSIFAVAITTTLALLPVVVHAQAQAQAPAQAQVPPKTPPAAPVDPFTDPYKQTCVVCHGEKMEGAPQGVPLVGRALAHGDSVDAIAKSIAGGNAQRGMPAFAATMDAAKIRSIATYIAETRANFSYVDFKVGAPPVVPTGKMRSEAQSFRIETVATDLAPLTYSIAPLPDGSMLLTEKTRGLRIIAADGKVSELVRGTPQVYDDGFQVPGILLVYGMGYMLDVAPHPDYAKNGWIYLSYTERCSDCNEATRKSKRPASMLVLVRGRIRNGEWVDQQVIWRTGYENYTSMVDMAAGGRIAFDGKGHVFLSIGIKGGSEFAGVQDLSLPYGKILRLNDDGSIPADNPFVKKTGALPEIWSYGHRSPEGLEFDRKHGRLWETEMGQRGGDEVNLLLPGHNYGWPLTSKGLRYEGIPVDYGKDLGITFDMKDIDQPRVDLTPAPAVSSFVVYDGAAFPKWRGNLLVGTLKATELYRMVLDGDQVVHRETLLGGLGRIRDVAVGRGGVVYLLLEHQSGSRVLRLVPVR